MTKFAELVAKLSELFELDKVDLDFGIHRIIKAKHSQIATYLQERLPEKVRIALGDLAQAESGDSLAELKRQIVDSMGSTALEADGRLAPCVADMPLGQKYNAAIKASQDKQSKEQVETEVYSHLYEFFSRYYEEGDFISRRRRKAGRETYAIPYDGEEVVLHWANKDQYYVKSSEDLKDYTFTVPLNLSGNRGRVQFKLTRMDAVQNNNKASRIFQLDSEAEIQATGDGLVIPFHFAEGKSRKQADEIAWEDSVLAALPPEWRRRLAARDDSYTGSGERTILQKHLRNYTKKNTSDYFIHKDLGGFLRRELDFYIKNEVMYLDDVDKRPADYLENELRKIKAIRAVAHDLIDFLAQFEDFQKRLWLKKKFVVETNWCITLDRIPEALYPEIAANDAQRLEWVRLFAIDEITATPGDLLTPAQPGYNEPLAVEFLKANDKLVLDTAFFPAEFKTRLLASIDDIDSQMDGLLIHSENFQALNLLQERYREQVKCIYIDPPYNLGPRDFMYKDNYQSSSWATCIKEAVSASLSLLRSDACMFFSIGLREMGNSRLILDSLFPEESHVGTFTWKARVKPVNVGDAQVRPQQECEFILGYEVGKGCGGFSKISSGSERTYPHETDGRRYRLATILKSNRGSSRRDTMRFEIAGYTPPDGQRWQGGESFVQNLHDTNHLEFLNGTPMRRYFEDEESPEHDPFYCYIDTELSSTSESGKTSLNSILGNQHGFDTVKPIELITYLLSAGTTDDSLVVDFFAGSGTTAHSVVAMNRNGSSRKFVLVEMGDYFDSLLKPRITNAIYASEWRNGKPASRDSGVSQCFKYIRLESYEDALNNLELEDRSADLLGLRELSPDLADDYLLRYSLDVETRVGLRNLEAFKNPFACMLKIYNRASGEAEPRTIDLPETFNYLLGLRVRTMQMRDGFLVVEGENPAAETILVIWRNLKEKDNAALAVFVTGTLRINPADTEYAAIYINGDTTLDDPHKKILLTEQVFYELMFDVKEL
ncbi:MAG: DNA methyltransferase [Lentisphaeria bacterium]|nr:DNA methyltransferase [Lentisphaeria bacterium]